MASTLLTGLTSYWKLDTNNAAQPDSHGSNDLTVTGATFTSSGKINGGYDLESTNSDYLQASSSISGTGDKTWSLWIKPESIIFSDIISNSKGIGSQPEGMDLWLNATGTLRANVGNTTSAEFLNTGNTTNMLSAGNWYHIILMQDTNQLFLYVNNTLWGSDLTSSGTELSPAYNFTLGTRPAFIDLFFDGIVDEVAIWNRGLTSDERTELYNSGAGLQYPFTSEVDNAINFGNNF